MLSNKKEKKHRDSISMVGPYARVRVVVAVLMFIFAFLVIGYRSLIG
jgi:hypothetical protein